MQMIKAGEYNSIDGSDCMIMVLGKVEVVCFATVVGDACECEL